MNKSQLIDVISESADITKACAARAIDAFTNAVQAELAQEGELSLVGFGKFYVQHKQERQGRNPQTGETITIPAKNIPAFKPGKGLSDGIK